MHDPASGILWRLIVEVDVCRSRPKQHVTRSSHFVVEHHLRPKHFLIEADRGSEVARKEMRMVKVTSDERLDAAQEPPRERPHHAPRGSGVASSAAQSTDR